MPTKTQPKRSLPTRGIDALDERARRARDERMTVVSLGPGIYEVESESGNAYHVDITASRCTCPDHSFRDVRCKHLRRVAIEITAGTVPPPGQIVVECERCGEETFVDHDAAEPYLCSEHELAPGDVVRDRETGDRVLVVLVSEDRADEVRIHSADCTVAEHHSNADYPADDPVIGVVYPQSLRLTDDGPFPESLKVYSFPRSRLDVSADFEEPSDEEQTQLDASWAM